MRAGHFPQRVSTTNGPPLVLLRGPPRGVTGSAGVTRPAVRLGRQAAAIEPPEARIVGAPQPAPVVLHGLGWIGEPRVRRYSLSGRDVDQNPVDSSRLHHYLAAFSAASDRPRWIAWVRLLTSSFR
jgi:hypothetical protein